MAQTKHGALPATPVCRLAIKLARTAPVAVLLRRGPTDWTQLIKWNVETDTFEQGQWFRGRVYEEACSLSDDGELFLYLARKGTKRTIAELGSETWTALSRPPYFTALALWPHPPYDGGGLFTGPRSVSLNFAASRSADRVGKLPVAMSVAFRGSLSCSSIGAEAAMAAGWQPMDKRIEAFRYHGWQLQSDWEKQSENGAIRLKFSARREKERRQVARTVLNFSLRRAGQVIEIGDADFVEIDQRQRLIKGAEGKIYVCSDPYAETLSWQVLADFSRSKPVASVPPSEAKQWPGSWVGAGHLSNE